jgi:dTMP kinase
MSIKRGALIVFEGCDRSGKTTQCKRLVESLASRNHKVKFMNFPNRQTQSGKILDAYLRNKQDVPDEAIHLLFSFNRWECKSEMEKELKAGTTLIIDRYCYSGVAYSSVKGLDFDWCKSPDTGLLRPDLVVYLTLSEEAMSKRGGFGNERYETSEIQKNVAKAFENLMDKSYWKVIDADKTEDQLSSELEKLVVEQIETVDEKIGKLW